MYGDSSWSVRGIRVSSGTSRNALVGRQKEKICFYFKSEVLSAQSEARTETEKRVLW